MGRRKAIDRLAQALQRVVKDLAELGARHALIGGIAVGSRTEPRFTRDIDLAVSVKGDDEAESLVRGLVQTGYRLEALLEQTATGRLATTRLFRPEDREVLVDLLFASCGIEREIVRDADALEVLGTRVRVASIGHLIATKVLSEGPGREQDRIDLGRLLPVASEQDLRDAEEALRLIEARGFHRRKRLTEKLARLSRRYRRKRR